MRELKTLRVRCSAGHHGDDTPQRFFLDRRGVDVVAILDRWISHDRRYYKCRGSDGNSYILLHDVEAKRWELTMFTSGAAPRDWGVAEPKSTH